MNIKNKCELKAVKAYKQYNVFTDLIKLVYWTITLYDSENPKDVAVTIDVVTKLNYEKCELSSFTEAYKLSKGKILEFALNTMGGQNYLDMLKANYISTLSKKKEELELVDLDISKIPD